MSSASPLAPTYHGHIASTQDALLLFEACLSGSLNHVARRPHDRERANLIKSGNVFIYEEHSSGIKRWTDGVPWSPSRILGNFLVYRELERPFPPGEKKRAMKRTSRRSPGVTKHENYGNSSSSLSNSYGAAVSVTTSFENPSGGSLSKETERALIGSLIDSYGFKDEGLVKKTVSVTVGSVSHHLVSYYTVADVTGRKLNSPSKDPRFNGIMPRADLVTKQNFRTPIDEVEPLDRPDERAAFAPPFSYERNAYEMTNQSVVHRQMALPVPQVGYGSSPGMYQPYNMSPNAGSYDAMPAQHAGSSFNAQYAQPQNMYPGPKQEVYNPSGYRNQPQQQPQRYNSVTSIGSDASRMGMPPVETHLARRASAYEHVSPLEQGLVGSSSTSLDSKMPNEGSYSAPQAYYNNVRAEDNSQQHQAMRSLPNPGQSTAFDRAALTPSYPLAGHQEQRDSVWSGSHFGNTSSGHGHYMASQQAWNGSQT